MRDAKRPPEAALHKCTVYLSSCMPSISPVCYRNWVLTRRFFPSRATTTRLRRRARRPLLPLLGWAAAMAALGTGPAGADEIRLLSGDKITGIVLEEVRDGVWVEVAPYVAVYYPYDRVVHAEKWPPERNATLFSHPPLPPPMPLEAVAGQVVLRTDAGEWVLVKPHMAVMVDAERRKKALARTRLAPGEAKRGNRLQILRQLSDSPEALSSAQLTHRLGPPTKRLRQGGELQWLYDLGKDGLAILHFRENKLEYVEILPAEPREK